MAAAAPFALSNVSLSTARRREEVALGKPGAAGSVGRVRFARGWVSTTSVAGVPILRLGACYHADAEGNAEGNAKGSAESWL